MPITFKSSLSQLPTYQPGLMNSASNYATVRPKLEMHLSMCLPLLPRKKEIICTFSSCESQTRSARRRCKWKLSMIFSSTAASQQWRHFLHSDWFTAGFPNKRTWEPSEKHRKAMLVKPAAISFQGEMPKRPAKVRHAFGSLKTALLVCVCVCLTKKWITGKEVFKTCRGYLISRSHLPIESMRLVYLPTNLPLISTKCK